MSEAFSVVKNYLSGGSKVNISIYRVESLLFIVASTLIMYVGWGTLNNVEIIFPEIPRQFLLSGTYDDITEELYIRTILVLFLVCMIKPIIIGVNLNKKHRALAYTIRNLIEIYYGVYVLRYSLSICDMYRNNEIKQVDNLVFVVAFTYLIIYKIVLYIYESWLHIVNHTYGPHAVFADKVGNPIYKGDYIAYKGQIYQVLESPILGRNMGDKNNNWIARGLYDGKTIDINEMIKDDGVSYLIKLKQSIYKGLAERD